MQEKGGKDRKAKDPPKKRAPGSVAKPGNSKKTKVSHNEAVGELGVGKSVGAVDEDMNRSFDPRADKRSVAGSKSSQKQSTEEKLVSTALIRLQDLDLNAQLGGKSMRGPAYQSDRTLRSMEANNLQDSTEYISLRAKRELMDLCEEASQLSSTAPETRPNLIETVCAAVDPLPLSFQTTLLLRSVRALPLETAAQVQEWIERLQPRCVRSGVPVC